MVLSHASLMAHLVCLPESGPVFELVPAPIDALGISGPALTLKSSGKLDLATMAQA